MMRINLPVIIRNLVPFLVFTAVMLICIFPLQAAADGDRLLGIWITPEKDRIQIFKTGNRYSGKPFVYQGQSQRLDVNNPDPKMRKRSLADVMILENFRYEDGKWSDGTIYDPKNGKTYRCIIRFQGDHEIQIRGYVGVPLFGRSELWTRANTNP